jgi:hypothetical protein
VQPTTEDSDPVVAALKTVLSCKEVTGFELLDSRWNGNEAFRYDTDKGHFFVKMNRVEDVRFVQCNICSIQLFWHVNTQHIAAQGTAAGSTARWQQYADLTVSIAVAAVTHYVHSAVQHHTAVAQCTTVSLLTHACHTLLYYCGNSVFMTEAVSLSALATVDALPCPKPLHLGKLPKVGDIGPGNTACTINELSLFIFLALVLLYAGRYVTGNSVLLLVLLPYCCYFCGYTCLY